MYIYEVSIYKKHRDSSVFNDLIVIPIYSDKTTSDTKGLIKSAIDVTSKYKTMSSDNYDYEFRKIECYEASVKEVYWYLYSDADKIEHSKSFDNLEEALASANNISLTNDSLTGLSYTPSGRFARPVQKGYATTKGKLLSTILPEDLNEDYSMANVAIDLTSKFNSSLINWR